MNIYSQGRSSLILWSIGLAMLVGSHATVVHADAAADCMNACGAMNSDSARLACFDRELAHHKAEPNSTTCAVMPHDANAAANPTLTAPEKSAAARGANPPASPAANPAAPRHERISGVIASVSRGSHGLLDFVLENGQVWEEVETNDNLAAMPNHTVTISPGLFGSFLLVTDSHQSVKVRQIR